MFDLQLPAGRWLDIDGAEPDQDLRFQVIGPALKAAVPGYLVLTGYRYYGDEPGPDFDRVMVRAEDMPGCERGHYDGCRHQGGLWPGPA